MLHSISSFVRSMLLAVLLSAPSFIFSQTIPILLTDTTRTPYKPDPSRMPTYKPFRAIPAVDSEKLMVFHDVEKCTLTFEVAPNEKVDVELRTENGAACVAKFGGIRADNDGYVICTIREAEPGECYLIYISVGDHIYKGYLQSPKHKADEKSEINEDVPQKDSGESFELPRPREQVVYLALYDTYHNKLFVITKPQKGLTLIIFNKEYKENPVFMKKYEDCTAKVDGVISVDVSDLPEGHVYLLYILDDENDMYSVGYFKRKALLQQKDSPASDEDFKEIELTHYFKEFQQHSLPTP